MHCLLSVTVVDTLNNSWINEPFVVTSFTIVLTSGAVVALAILCLKLKCVHMNSTQ